MTVAQVAPPTCTRKFKGKELEWCTNWFHAGYRTAREDCAKGEKPGPPIIVPTATEAYKHGFLTGWQAGAAACGPLNMPPGRTTPV